MLSILALHLAVQKIEISTQKARIRRFRSEVSAARLLTKYIQYCIKIDFKPQQRARNQIGSTKSRLILAIKLSCLAILVSLCAKVVAAQGNSGYLVMEEIIVTAEKREASIQDVGIAVSALDESAVERLNARDIRDLQALIPNLP
jgi:hypothetical protein